MDLLKEPGVVKCGFKKGDYIIRQGQEVQYLYYLATGTCYRTTFTEKGDEIIFGVKESSKNIIPSLLGVLILYSNGISTSNFIAKSNCLCYRIPKETFLQYVQDKPDVLSQMLQMAMGELRELASSFQSRQEGKIANRLCAMLLENAEDKQGELVVKKEYNNIRISQFLGIHKVTTARILKTLRDEGVINRRRDGIIILNKEQMVSYAEAKENIKY